MIMFMKDSLWFWKFSWTTDTQINADSFFSKFLKRDINQPAVKAGIHNKSAEAQKHQQIW